MIRADAVGLVFQRIVNVYDCSGYLEVELRYSSCFEAKLRQFSGIDLCIASKVGFSASSSQVADNTVFRALRLTSQDSSQVKNRAFSALMHDLAEC
jgi:hypothetical protein